MTSRQCRGCVSALTPLQQYTLAMLSVCVPQPLSCTQEFGQPSLTITRMLRRCCLEMGPMGHDSTGSGHRGTPVSVSLRFCQKLWKHSLLLPCGPCATLRQYQREHHQQTQKTHSVSGCELPKSRSQSRHLAQQVCRHLGCSHSISKSLSSSHVLSGR